jgi:hypothetical protein
MAPVRRRCLTTHLPHERQPPASRARTSSFAGGRRQECRFCAIARACTSALLSRAWDETRSFTPTQSLRPLGEESLSGARDDLCADARFGALWSALKPPTEGWTVELERVDETADLKRQTVRRCASLVKVG